MENTRLKAVLDRVLTWAPDRQDDAAKLLEGLEAQNETGCRLTPEQVDEVRRRRADPSAETLSLAEFNDRLRRYGR